MFRGYFVYCWQSIAVVAWVGRIEGSKHPRQRLPMLSFAALSPDAPSSSYSYNPHNICFILEEAAYLGLFQPKGASSLTVLQNCLNRDTYSLAAFPLQPGSPYSLYLASCPTPNLLHMLVVALECRLFNCLQKCIVQSMNLSELILALYALQIRSSVQIRAPTYRSTP